MDPKAEIPVGLEVAGRSETKLRTQLLALIGASERILVTRNAVGCVPGASKA